VYNSYSEGFLSTIDLLNDRGGVTPGATPNLGRQNRILLNEFGINSETIIHELGHVLDNNSVNNALCSATWCGGGYADNLVNYAGISPSGVRWYKNIKESIPESFRWDEDVNGGYGNSSSADYGAEAFYWFIVDQSNLPNSSIGKWMTTYVSQH
jgi:hypothetical protein